MAWKTLSLLPIVVAATTALRTAGDDHAVSPEEAGAAYRKNCAACHLPPDRKFATDRAWIDQIQRTA